MPEESTKPHTHTRRWWYGGNLPNRQWGRSKHGPVGFGVAPRAAAAGVRWGRAVLVRGDLVRNLPAAVQSIVPGRWWSCLWCSRRERRPDVGQLSDRELRVELAVSSAWTYREHSRWWSEETSGEQFLRMLEACGPAAVLLG